MKYLYEHKKSDKDNESGIYRSTKCKDVGLLDNIEGVKNIFDLICLTVDKYGDKNSCGYRSVEKTITEKKKLKKKVGDEIIEEEKEWNYYKMSKFNYWSYNTYLNNILKISTAFKTLNISKDNKILFFAPTSPFWTTMAHACFYSGIVIATVYDTLGSEGLLHAIEECETNTIFLDKINYSILNKVLEKTKIIKNIIFVELKDFEIGELKQKDLNIFTYDDLLNYPDESFKKADTDPEEVACVMYTSGSTGNPKGVLITHSNIVKTIAGVDQVLRDSINEEDTIALFLPLSHILAFATDIYCFYRGVFIGYCSPRTLIDSSVRECNGDLRELKPTLLMGVPQVYDSIKKGVMIKVGNDGLKKTLFNMFFSIKSLLGNESLVSKLIDIISFNKIKDQTGGNLRWCMSGGAPLSDDISEFISTTMCTLSQGYGLTETCGLSIVNTLDIKNKSNVGQLIPQNEIKLIDFEEAKYSHKNNPPQGEICFRGGSIVKGYFKNDNATKEAFDEDGWFHTGDIAQINKDGTISIIDRKKNIAKLANGEYIAIEKLESIYKNSIFVSNIMVHVNSEKNKPVALIVPNLNAIKEFIQSSKAKTVNDLSDVSGDKEITKIIFDDCLKEAKSNNLKGSQLLACVFLCDEEWNVENDCLTPSQKMKRKNIVSKYENELNKLLEFA